MDTLIENTLQIGLTMLSVTFSLAISLLSALKTATQVKGQHKYLNDSLKKSNICVEEHPSVSKYSLQGDCRRGKGYVRGIENIDKDKYRTSTVSDHVQEAQAGSSLVGSNSLGAKLPPKDSTSI